MIILRGCKRCGGDVADMATVDHEVVKQCVQCGREQGFVEVVRKVRVLKCPRCPMTFTEKGKKRSHYLREHREANWGQHVDPNWVKGSVAQW